MGNPNIDPRVAPHDASYLTNISFIVIMYVNHFSIIICEQHPFFFFFCGFQCQSYDFKTIYLTIIPRARAGYDMVYRGQWGA